jgi:hypothetical protein
MKLALIPVILATAGMCGGLLDESATSAAPSRPQWSVSSADLVVLAQPGPGTAASQMQQEAALMAASCLPGETLTSYWLPDNDDDDAQAVPPVLGETAPPPPTPPMLRGRPGKPTNPTEYTKRQYDRKLKDWQTSADEARARWQAGYQATDRAWDQQQVLHLRQAAQAPAPEDLDDEPWDVAGGLQRAALSLHLNHPSDPSTIARRDAILVVLVNLGQLSAPGSLPAGLLSGVRVIVANYDGPTPSATWAGTLRATGAVDITVIPAALTDSQLPNDVAALMGGQGC